MNAQEINSTYDLLTLAEKHTKLKRAGRFWSGPCPFCGGTDRFTIKQLDQGYLWYCRKCAPKYHSPIDYVMRYGNLDFKAALTTMGGKISEPPSLNKKYQKANRLPPLKGGENQVRFLARIDEGIKLLSNPVLGEPGCEYLIWRGLHPGTWNTFSLGFEWSWDPWLEKRRPAILIPWMDDKGISCMNFRFIDNQVGGLRYKTIGKKTLFGLNAAWHAPILVVCEGELNAMSIHQAAAAVGGLGLAVVSIGSETHSDLAIALLKSLVKIYPKLICWFDETEIAQGIVETIKRPAKVLASPIIDDLKYDANELLKAGKLPAFLELATKEM